MSSKTIKVDYLARVEGEGALYIRIKDDRVTQVQLKIFEPPRFFEAFLQGRKYTEAPDITARICGICPVAYQMSSVHALEQILGLKVAGPLRELRRLIYCGEWIESHGLHVYMLHAPDFLGYADAIQMARDYPEAVKRGLKLKQIGNELVALVGGREIHPINVRVGGFYSVPRKKDLVPMVEKLKWARDAALETVRWVSTFNFPPVEPEYEFVSLRHPQEYPFNEGRLVSNKGLDIAVDDFEAHFEEEHVPYTTALHSILKARGAYYVGPMARYNNNFDLLPPAVQAAAQEAGLTSFCCNPFQSIIIRSIEILYACEESLRIIDQYEQPERPYLEAEPRAGIGHGISEAPRGSLYHRYRIDDQGVIQEAKIVPPTSQNQKTVESDLYQVAVQNLHLPEDQLTWICEQAIRNYDPCISCSVHFLKLHLERR
ncbi:MAG: Ni/Fe hydrogenase subunit alpha [Desulfobacca sp. 4484_104]|nr:MAG: Ni/Fe hydrogenase subunit alpha [Desulfobacca sp. 4484_104]RLA89639.1 MAG: Ni/Fe hydrogenase subunit alpha [Deltaproteobacteria bacterium]